MPFSAPNDQLLFDLIKKGKFSFPENKQLSSDSISLINGLLKIKPEERYSASQALDHPWFASMLAPKPIGNFSFSGLTHYLKLDKMQKLVVAYIASHTSDAELVKQMNCFVGLNTSKSGILSKEEIEKWVLEKGSPSKKYASESPDLFAGIDINQSKGIEYLGIFYRMDFAYLLL